MTAAVHKIKEYEKQISLLQKRYQAIVEFTDKMEQCGQFQGRLDITSSINQIWKVFLDDIKNTIRVYACALLMVDEETYEFVLKDISPPDKGYVCQKEIDFQIECGMFSWVVNRRQPSLIPSFVFKDNKTIIMLPLTTVRRTLGMIMVLTPIKESLITQENLKLLTILARQCSLVMENTILYDHLRKEHESLIAAQEQIIRAEKLASIGRLTSGASHAILNPLNIIYGNIQLMQMDKTINPKTDKYLKVMRAQTKRIEKIVKRLSQFSSSSNRKIKTINLNSLIEKVIGLIEHEIKYDDIKIIKELDPDLALISGDEDRLLEVFFVLLSNARDATPQGGTFRISTGQIEDKNRMPGESGFIRIKFQDNGCGIEQENISKIFEPFFTTKEVGAGLGLAISYGIIKDHKGTIDIESRLNEGSTVTICLPASK